MDSKITLNQTEPRLGEVVTFTVSYPKQIKDARIEVIAKQDGVQVYRGDAEAYQQFLLGVGPDSTWESGPAEVVATLYYWDFRPRQRMAVLAKTEPFVAGDRAAE